MKRAAVVLLGLVLLASGCSLGPREDWAEAIRDSFELARREGGAHVKQSVAVKAIETNIRAKPVPLVATSTGDVDFANGRAELTGSVPRKMTAVYDDLVVYASRSKGSIDADGGPAWARFDYGAEPKTDIDANDRRTAIGAGLVSPTLAVELLDGILTGSVDEIGTGMKAGVETTHYRAKLAPDAAVNEIDDEDRGEGVQRMFETLAVQQADFPVDIWLDADQRVRAVRYVMRQQKDRVNAFTLTASWEFSDYGSAAPIDVPASGDVIRSPRYRDFVTELIREVV